MNQSGVALDMNTPTEFSHKAHVAGGTGALPLIGLLAFPPVLREHRACSPHPPAPCEPNALRGDPRTDQPPSMYVPRAELHPIPAAPVSVAAAMPPSGLTELSQKGMGR